MLLAVNGTLMRGLELNQNMLDAGAVFVREAHTAPIYRLWSIQDRYPGMLRVRDGGSAIVLEIWDVSSDGLMHILANEPPGLSIGWVVLTDQTVVLGVLAEAYALEDNREITAWGGWRSYRAQLH